MTIESIHIDALMNSSGVGFGTSGARGRVEAMTDSVCYTYTLAFLQHLTQAIGLEQGSSVAVAGDFRTSTPRIMAAVAAAISDCGYVTVNCGHIASPAVANYGIRHQIPSIMVTGSHIPDDRNGIKFNTAQGEILKDDEISIRQQTVELNTEEFNAEGNLIKQRPRPQLDNTAASEFISRNLGFFPTSCLQGMKIGLYEHSTVVRQALYEVLTGLGAEVVKLGYSEQFLPVDTEAIRSEDVELAHQWNKEYAFDAIVSADGDGDRPLISDEHGEWLRGDVVGVLAAEYLGADIAVTPVSSNTLVEKCGLFDEVARTRIGSPYVIAAMQNARSRHPEKVVVGYEANGGFLTETPIRDGARELSPLPTRDCILPIVSILVLSRKKGMPISALLKDFPMRYTYSDRIKEFPTALSQQNLARFKLDDNAESLKNIGEFLGSEFAAPLHVDTTDGVRITLENDDIVHFRPSGNAPELRCYSESSSAEAAETINKMAIERLEMWRS